MSKTRYIEKAILGFSVLVWLFVAIVIRPGILVLLLFAAILTALEAIGRAMLRWGREEMSTPVAASLLAFGVLLLTWAWLHLFAEPHPAVSLGLILLMAGPIVYGQRAWNREQADS